MELDHKIRLAFVSAHPAPYRDPFLRRIAAVERLQVSIFTLYGDDNAHSYWDLGAHGYPSELLANRGMHWFRVFVRLLKRIICGGYDVICWPGFHRPETKLAMFVSALFGQKYGFCADSVTQPERGGLLMMVKRFIIRRSKFIFVPGLAGRDFFVREFDYPPERICFGQYALEGEAIERGVLELRGMGDGLANGKNDKVRGIRSIRRRYGLGANDVVFLMVANMLENRHYPITAAAFCRFVEALRRESPEEGRVLRFVMVGKGHDLEQMEMMAKVHPELIVIPGVSFAEMQELYAAADVYVHGGTEPASTALVIGAIAHLPVMSSPAVGCTADVVREGVTGCLIRDFLSEDEWTAAFRKMWDQKRNWGRYGEMARRLSQAIDCANVVEPFVQRVIVAAGK